MKIRVEVEKLLRLKKGQTKTPVQFRLFNMDTFLPVDLTASQIKFFMHGDEITNQAKKVQGKGDVVVSGLTGIGKYDWKVGDTDTPGLYKSEFEITLSDGTKLRVPTGDDYIKINIEDD